MSLAIPPIINDFIKAPLYGDCISQISLLETTGGPKGKSIDHEGKESYALKVTSEARNLKHLELKRHGTNTSKTDQPKGIETLAKKQPKGRNYVHFPITTPELTPT